MTLTVFAFMDPVYLLARLSPDPSNQLTRHIKAALLYADEVVAQDLFWGPHPCDPPGSAPWIVLDSRSRQELTPALKAGVVRFRPGVEQRSLPSAGVLTLSAGQDPREALAQLFGRPHSAFALLSSPEVPLFPTERMATDAAAGATWAELPDARAQGELSLAATLIGHLPAFPDAEIDAILDVRDRLRDARVRFRATMAAASERFAEVPAEDFAAEVELFRRETLEPALLDLREHLEELGAISMLARVVTQKATVPMTAALSLGAGQISPVAAVIAAVAGGLGAIGAQEWNARREIQRDAKRMPYWYLAEANRLLETG